MSLTIYQVDAFASEVFRGNPAAVIPLDEWLDDTLLQSIALENNLSETAYFVVAGEGFELRWFTPEVEVDLCGHATLAAAHVLFEHMGYAGDEIRFDTRGGALTVSRSSDGLTLDFPAAALEPVAVDNAICSALGATASEAFSAPGRPGMLLYVYEFEEDVAALAPDFAALAAASEQCIIATAPGDNCHVVSRFFGPQVGVNEDPVTGSAHCVLVPYWARRLDLDALHCRQISARRGDLACRYAGGRVFMTGTGLTFMQGTVFI